VHFDAAGVVVEGAQSSTIVGVVLLDGCAKITLKLYAEQRPVLPRPAAPLAACVQRISSVRKTTNITHSA